MNINVATWGRLLKRNLNFQKSITNTESRSESHSSSTGKFTLDPAVNDSNCLNTNIYSYLETLRDIWQSNFESFLSVVHFFNVSVI